jgi:hypothetical protein
VFDLATRSSEDLCELRPPIDPEALPAVFYLPHLEVHPSARRALTRVCDTPAALVSEIGVRERVFVIDLEDGTFEPVSEPFIDAQQPLQREQRCPRWLERSSETRPVVIADSLGPLSRERPKPPASGMEYLAMDARRLLVAALNASVGYDPPRSSDFQILRNEALRAAFALREYAPAELTSLEEWIDQIARSFFVGSHRDTDLFDELKADGARKFAVGWQLITERRDDELDWQAARYVSA